MDDSCADSSVYQCHVIIPLTHANLHLIAETLRRNRSHVCRRGHETAGDGAAGETVRYKCEISGRSIFGATIPAGNSTAGTSEAKALRGY